MDPSARPCDGDVAELSAIIEGLTGTRDNVRMAKSWLLSVPPTRSPAVFNEICRLMCSPALDPTKKLFTFYFLNDTLAQMAMERRDPSELDGFTVAILPFLKSIVYYVHASLPTQEERDKVPRVLNLWSQKKQYQQPFYGQFGFPCPPNPQQMQYGGVPCQQAPMMGQAYPPPGMPYQMMPPQMMPPQQMMPMMPMQMQMQMQYMPWGAPMPQAMGYQGNPQCPAPAQAAQARPTIVATQAAQPPPPAAVQASSVAQWFQPQDDHDQRRSQAPAQAHQMPLPAPPPAPVVATPQPPVPVKPVLAMPAFDPYAPPPPGILVTQIKSMPKPKHPYTPVNGAALPPVPPPAPADLSDPVLLSTLDEFYRGVALCFVAVCLAVPLEVAVEVVQCELPVALEVEVEVAVAFEVEEQVSLQVAVSFALSLGLVEQVSVVEIEV
eukprot:m51a1_g3239 hypothetical protein (437) ;mRNA; r:123587-125211